jgi:3-oxoacyl-[acyl-carrier protein] reductase
MGNRKPATGVAVITGGAAGIGEAIARRLSADGFAVVIADLDGNRAEEIATEISAHGEQAAGRQLDVSAAESVAALFEWLTHDIGRCDVVVNNAGIATAAPLSELPLEGWNSTIAINVTGVLLMTQHALPLMKKGGWGRIGSAQRTRRTSPVTRFRSTVAISRPVSLRSDRSPFARLCCRSCLSSGSFCSACWWVPAPS